MNRPGVIYLITENAQTHGVHDTVENVERKVLCTVKGVTRSEYYNALNAGIQPTCIFVLAMAEEYHNERICKYKGQKYYIQRAYEPDDGGIELTAERSDVNGSDDND